MNAALQATKNFSLKEILPTVNEGVVMNIMQAMKSFAPNSWHKWNAYDHSLKVCETAISFMDSSDPYPYFSAYGSKDTLVVAKNILFQKIDGIEKWRLLALAALLHDVGKGITLDRELARGHTRLSVQLLEENRERFNLTDPQFKFIKVLVENHHKFDKLEVSEDLEYSKKLLPVTEYLSESVLFALFDILSCQGAKFTDPQAVFYKEACGFIKNRQLLVQALILEKHTHCELADHRIERLSLPREIIEADCTA